MAGGDRVVSALAGHLQDYLRMRRGLGFALRRIDNNLERFVAYLDAAGERTVTVAGLDRADQIGYPSI